jgi:hypothetical protein
VFGVERAPFGHLTLQQLLVIQHKFARLKKKAQQILWRSRVAASSTQPLNAVPLTRNAFVRLHYVAVRQSEMLAWVMHDSCFFFSSIAFFRFSAQSSRTPSLAAHRESPAALTGKSSNRRAFCRAAQAGNWATSLGV